VLIFQDQTVKDEEKTPVCLVQQQPAVVVVVHETATPTLMVARAVAPATTHHKQVKEVEYRVKEILEQEHLTQQAQTEDLAEVVVPVMQAEPLVATLAETAAMALRPLYQAMPLPMPAEAEQEVLQVV